jgi:DNA-binding PadR family transcriptional regulator
MRTAKDQGGAASRPDLTDNEGSLLALVLRSQPITAYQVLKVYERSPVSSFNESKGSVYPLIRRLKERGLLLARQVEGDGRNSERLSCSKAGKEAVRRWVMQVRPAHVLLDDPLRTKVISFGLLDREEQLEWLARVRAIVAAKIEEIEAYDAHVSIPFQAMVQANTMIALQARIEWLDALSRTLSDAAD